MTAVHPPLPVQGALDTSGPIGSRPAGTLVEATDLDTLSWAPRHGFTQRSWVYRAPAASFPNHGLPVFDGTLGYGSTVMRVKEQYNLGTKWTLDVVFRPETVTHSSDAAVPIFQWYLGFEAIGLYLVAGGAVSGAQRKLQLLVTPTSAPGVAGTTSTLTGTTQLSVGTALVNTHHVRAVRDGATLTLTCDGVQEAEATNLSAAQRHEASATVATSATAYLGTASGLATGATHLFKGRIARALLRSSAATDATKGMRDFSFPKSPGVRFAHCGRMTYSGLGQIEESSFGAPLRWSGMTFENVTEPAPWFETPIQGGTYFVDSLGRAWNVVVCGGWIYARRAG